MAHIEERKQSNGKMSYRAEVVVRVDGKRKKKSKTFELKTSAVKWARNTEKLLKQNGTDELFEKNDSPKTVADAVDRYMTSVRIALKDTKKQVLGFVRDGRCEFSDMKLSELSSHDVLDFAQELANGGCAPPTVSSYLAHVCYVLENAEDDFGKSYHVSIDALDRGKKSARRLGLSGKSDPRERRPTLDELDLLMTYFQRRSEANALCLPMHLIIAFAIFGCRRQSEITGILWKDLEGEDMLVRKTKHPRRPQGIDIPTIVTPEALRVIKTHGKRNPVRIFPYSADVISRLFTDACKLLEIEDLHFHDLRHEGVSWLLEKGWSVRHTMMVSGHSSTQTLDRYSNLKERGDKYDSWPWLDILEN